MLHIVRHHGVPIARVELPHDRSWAGGRLEPLPAFAAVAALLAIIAAAPSRVAELLELPDGATLRTDGMPPEVAEAYRALAAHSFDLADEAGLPVGAELVRIGATADAVPVVRVYFRDAPSGVGATVPPPPQSAGDTAS